MKLIKVCIELVIDDIDCLNDKTTDGNYYNKGKISDYLNNKLYTDPEYFGDFGPENIVTVKEIE
jgi:hypothetical protein